MRAPLTAAGMVLVLSLYLLACNRGLLYRGDGHLADAGFAAAIDRYVVDLGPIDLGTNGVRHFVLAGLPNTTMTIGFQASPSLEREKLRQTKPLFAGVHLIVTRADGTVVIDENGRLPTWVWSSKATSLDSFIYRRGQSERVALQNGFHTNRRLGVRSDAGWGTSFDPDPFRRYDVAVRVWEPMVGRPYPVRVLVKGGGWK